MPKSGGAGATVENELDGRSAWYQLVSERIDEQRRILDKLEVSAREDIKALEQRVLAMERSVNKIKTQALMVGALLALIASEGLKWASTLVD